VASGNVVRTCYNGVWSSLVCTGPLACGTLSPPPSGQGSCPVTQDSGTCQQVCDISVLAGSETRTCSNGVWSTLTCLAPASCPDLAAPQYGSGTCAGPIQSGGTCAQTCTFGVLSGSLTRYCTNGAWDSLTCSPSAGPLPCAAISSPANGGGSCDQMNDGEVCYTQTCDFGVESGSLNRTCTHGVWSPLVCQAGVDCSAIPPPMFGKGDCQAAPDGQTCVQSCDWGVASTTVSPTIVSSLTLTIQCNNGNWSIADCLAAKSCLFQAAPKDGTGTCPQSAHGGSCTQKCPFGIISGNTSRTCQNGEWLPKLNCSADPSKLSTNTATTTGRKNVLLNSFYIVVGLVIAFLLIWLIFQLVAWFYWKKKSGFQPMKELPVVKPQEEGGAPDLGEGQIAENAAVDSPVISGAAGEEDAAVELTTRG